MGKSTTAQMFTNEGCPIWDADAVVHKLYGPGGLGAAYIAELVPHAVDRDGVDRSKLRAAIAEDPTLLPRIETGIHPFVAADRKAFIQEHNDPVLVFEIPLLFETGADAELDAVAVTSTSEQEQMRRVLARQTMDEASLRLILSKQMPDCEKRARADFIIDTTTLDSARQDVRSILTTISERMKHA